MSATLSARKTAPPSSLSEFATEANENHHAAKGAAESAIEYARRAGAALIEAKALVPHGQWSAWLTDNCPDIGIRSAQTYMQIVRRLGSNAQHAAHLAEDPQSLRQAMLLIAEPKPRSGRGNRSGPFREWPEDERREWLNSHWGWEQFPQEAFLLTAMGWDIDDIAGVLLCERREVEVILNPVPPVRFDTLANGRGLFDEGFDRIAVAYRANVEKTIVRILQHATRRLLNGEWQEVPDDAAAEIRGIDRQLSRRAELLSEQCILRRPLIEDAYENALLWVHATEDARAALGIVPVACPGQLTKWFIDSVDANEVAA